MSIGGNSDRSLAKIDDLNRSKHFLVGWKCHIPECRPSKHYARNRFVCTWKSNQTFVTNKRVSGVSGRAFFFVWNACTFTHPRIYWHCQWHWRHASQTFSCWVLQIEIFASFNWSASRSAFPSVRCVCVCAVSFVIYLLPFNVDLRYF